jgi:hypothetical protein
MKRTNKFIIPFAVFLMSVCSLVYGQKAAKITISNPLSINRADELIILKRALLQKKMGRLDGFVNIAANGTPQVVQHDDLDGDGTWDELVFLYSFAPGEQVAFTATTFSKPQASVVPRAHVRLKKKAADDSFGPNLKMEVMPLLHAATDFSKQPLPLYLTEGPGWENDKVAFRLYFDVRNGKDIFGKRTARMVLDSVGTNVKSSYHDLNEWGMDILHAGKSLGAGALAFSIPTERGEDTLIRLGGQHIKRTVYDQIADGPVRAVFKITYDWEIVGTPVQVTEQTSIWGGQYFYEGKVTVTGAPAGTKLVIGIASFYSNVFQSFSEAGSTVLLSHGRQSENKDYLGMAVLAPAQSVAHIGAAPTEGSDILNTYYVAQNIKAKTPNLFRFYAGWERTDGRFVRLRHFRELLKRESQKLAHPVIIK